MQFLRGRKTLPDKATSFAVFGDGNIEDDDRVTWASGIDEEITGLYVAVDLMAVTVERESPGVDEELLEPSPIARMIARSW